jgi:hypothetical protein
VAIARRGNGSFGLELALHLGTSTVGNERLSGRPRRTYTMPDRRRCRPSSEPPDLAAGNAGFGSPGPRRSMGGYTRAASLRIGAAARQRGVASFFSSMPAPSSSRSLKAACDGPYRPKPCPRQVRRPDGAATAASRARASRGTPRSQPALAHLHDNPFGDDVDSRDQIQRPGALLGLQDRDDLEVELVEELRRVLKAADKAPRGRRLSTESSTRWIGMAPTRTADADPCNDICEPRRNGGTCSSGRNRTAASRSGAESLLILGRLGA